MRESDGCAGVAVGFCVGVAVAVEDGVAVAVEVGVAVAVGDGVAEAVAEVSAVRFLSGCRFLTVTLTTPTFLVFFCSFSRTVILALPTLRAVILPFLETLAIFGLEDL